MSFFKRLVENAVSDFHGNVHDLKYGLSKAKNATELHAASLATVISEKSTEIAHALQQKANLLQQPGQESSNTPASSPNVCQKVDSHHPRQAPSTIPSHDSENNGNTQIPFPVSDSNLNAAENEHALSTSLSQISSESLKLQTFTLAEQLTQITIAHARSILNDSAVLSKDDQKRLQAQLVDAERKASQEAEKVEEARKTINGLKTECARLQAKVGQERRRQSAFEEGETKRLHELWSMHFPKFIFARQPLSWAVQRRHDERISLESKLIELHSCSDPVALSRGKMRTTGEHHLKFRLNDVECRMFYRVVGSSIEILELGTNQEIH